MTADVFIAHEPSRGGGPGPVSAGELGDLVTRTQEKEKGHKRRERESGRPRGTRGHLAEPATRQVSGPDGFLDFVGVSKTPCRCLLLRSIFQGETAGRREKFPLSSVKLSPEPLPLCSLDL